MVKSIVDVLTIIFGIALAAFLIKNAKNTATVAGAGTSGITSIVKAITFQN